MKGERLRAAVVELLSAIAEESGIRDPMELRTMEDMRWLIDHDILPWLAYQDVTERHYQMWAYGDPGVGYVARVGIRYHHPPKWTMPHGAEWLGPFYTELEAREVGMRRVVELELELAAKEEAK